MSQKPAGRHAEIVPRDGSHYVLVDGKEWARFDILAKAEALRNSIVAQRAAYYEERAAKLEQPAEVLG